MMRLVLLSGGMDSAMLLAREVSKGIPAAVFFEYGQANLVPERKAAAAICRDLGVAFISLSLPSLTRNLSPGAIIPSRNLIFCSVAANLIQSLGGGTILLGACAEDQSGFPDCRPEFIDAVNQILEISELNSRVEAPHAYLTKSQALDLFREEGLPQEVLEHSYSCYSGSEPPCRRCPACLKRAAAFFPFDGEHRDPAR